MTELQTVTVAARAHATALSADVRNASSRQEAIRLSVLAAEANRVASDLEALCANFSMSPAEA